MSFETTTVAFKPGGGVCSSMRRYARIDFNMRWLLFGYNVRARHFDLIACDVTGDDEAFSLKFLAVLEILPFSELNVFKALLVIGIL